MRCGSPCGGVVAFPAGNAFGSFIEGGGSCEGVTDGLLHVGDTAREYGPIILDPANTLSCFVLLSLPLL